MGEPATDDGGKKLLGAGRHLQLVSKNGWEYAERKGATGVVVILAVTDQGQLIVTEQYRQPIDARVVDLPAGLAGDEPGQEHEQFAEAARRELLEETGYAAREFVYLAEAPSSAGLTSEVVTFFSARGLARTAHGGGDASEEIEVYEIALDDIQAWLNDKRRAGVAVDVKLLAGLYLAGAQCRA